MSIIGVIEIPRGSNYKYEIEKETGGLILDRVLEHHYPANYGFIPNTLSEDGDALDIFVYSETPIHPLAKVKLEVVGVIEMVDNGLKDDKLICRIENSLCVFDQSFSQISYFLRNYKNKTVITSIGDKERALEILTEAAKRKGTGK
jgi:inorganic pyrophosphatase